MHNDPNANDTRPARKFSILRLIRERDYAPGERIPSERDLAIKFAVARPTIREELSILESMRIVERRPNSGVYVRQSDRETSLDVLALEADLGLPMTPGEVRDLNEFRKIIELQAVEIACNRRTNQDIQCIDLILRQTKEAIHNNQAVTDLDADFHLAICGATQNRVLSRAAYSFWSASKRRRDHYFADSSNGVRSLKEHQSLFECIEARDVTAAKANLERHLGGVERYWLETLEQAQSVQT